jgi:hypothetical protein
MLFLSSVLLSTLILTTGTLSDIADGEWTAPGVDIHLIESINVNMYGEPLADMLGRVSFVDTADGEKWRLVLVNTNNITVLEEGLEPARIPYSFEADKYVMSPDNKYILLTRNTHSGYNAARVNSDTGEIIQFNCCPEEYYPGTLLVSNTGSVVSWFQTGISFYNSNLEEQRTLDAYPRGSYIINRVEDGSVTFIASGNSLQAYDVSGVQIWNNDTIEMDGFSSFQAMAVSPRGNTLVITTPHSWTLLNASSGDMIRTKKSDRFTNVVMFNPNNDRLYCGSFTSRSQDEGSNAGIEILSTSYESEDDVRIEIYPEEEFRTSAAFTSSVNGLFMYHINHYDGERTLLLAGSKGNSLWSDRTAIIDEYISGTAYNTPYLSFGELARDGSKMCPYVNGRFKIYYVGGI